MTSHTMPTAFWGPNKRYMRPPDWPWPYNIHLQLYDLKPGDLWDPAVSAEIFLPHVLQPLGSPGHFIFFRSPWFFQYRHRADNIRIVCTWSTVIHHTFELNVRHGVQQFAYNERTGPTGVFAYGGYASFAWKAL